MALFSPLLSFVPRIGADPTDSDEVRLEKTVLVGASLLIILAALIWGPLYIFFGEPLAGLISLVYMLVTLVSLLIFHRTRRHHFLFFSQTFLGLILPFVHTIVLGGLWSSSVVFLWGLVSPVGALLFYEFRRAKWWWLAYLALLILVVYIQPSIEHVNNLPPALIRALFVMNVAGVSSIILFVLSYFIWRKNEAYRLLRIEEAKAENLLLNILPKEIAAILKNENRTIADSFDGASILFADLVGFTSMTAHMAPKEMVDLLNEIFSQFDLLVEKYDVEKIRTIGDNYMVAAGVPRPCPDHAHRLAAMALDMQAYIEEHCASIGLPLAFRIGISSGPVIGGVIGRKKFVYDIWGDAVNIASRMESQGVAGKIQLTAATYALIRDRFSCERRGTLQIKGRGSMETWFLTGRKREQAAGEQAAPEEQAAEARS